ncbi:PREDICTED: FERM domain-containing protein 8 [Sturnus vulgaris]|uniref:FERM domain-containing protein 8 n=1 Tax=Sturnus vulgaris TaxID=9172 RepID=UPI00071A849D|nr:PREDICTED: FERM domain-containing protein 8 [Sturnus vulgaris]
MDGDGEGEGEGASAPPGAAALLYLPDGSALPLPLEPPPGPTAAELLRRLQGALRLPPAAGDALALWLGSELLEVQLKPRHRPLRLVRHWPELLLRFSLGSPAAIAQDEPCLQLRRNVFFPKSRELELQEEELLRLLYEEAREQLRGGRYPVDPPEAAELGGLSCRLRLGPFEPGRHTELSLRPLLGELLPPGPPARWGALFRRSREPGPSQRLLEAFARAPGPEAPPDGGQGGTVGDPPVPPQHVLLSLTYPELCWELVGAVGQDGDPEGQDGDSTEPPQLWLEFDGDHEGAPVNRLLRVFSPQAELMSALIECCIELGGAAPPPESQATPPEGQTTPPEGQATPPGAAAATPPEPSRGAPLRRQKSVTEPRLQRLATIDYVRDGQELRRVKPPRRSVSFFIRGGAGGGSYSPVAGGTGGAGPEQG